MAKGKGESMAKIGSVKAEAQAVAIVPQGNIAEIISENLGSAGITATDLDRVKIPAGGGVAFEVPSLEGSEMVKFIEGVVVHHQDQNAFWPDPLTGSGIPPACVSRDGRMGIGDPGGVCARCPFNEYGSDARGRKGKACKNVKVLFVLQTGALLPTALFLPPTSIKTARQYLLRLTSAGIPFYGVKSKFALVKTKNADGIEYSMIDISTVTINEGAATAAGRLSLPEAAIADVRKYREAIIPMLAGVSFDAADVVE